MTMRKYKEEKQTVLLLFTSVHCNGSHDLIWADFKNDLLGVGCGSVTQYAPDILVYFQILQFS